MADGADIGDGHAYDHANRITSSSLSLVGQFHGRPGDDAVSWLQRLNRLAQPIINNWNGKAKMAVALTMLCGDAGLWARTIDENMLWPAFELAFLERFGEPAEEAMARLARCKQGDAEPIQVYTDRFKKDASLAGRVEDRALIYQYMEGMHCYLNQEVLRQGTACLQAGIHGICQFLKTLEPALACGPYSTSSTNIHDWRVGDDTCCTYGIPSQASGPSRYYSPHSSWSRNARVNKGNSKPDLRHPGAYFHTQSKTPAQSPQLAGYSDDAIYDGNATCYNTTYDGYHATYNGDATYNCAAYDNAAYDTYHASYDSDATHEDYVFNDDNAIYDSSAATYDNAFYNGRAANDNNDVYSDDNITCNNNATCDNVNPCNINLNMAVEELFHQFEELKLLAVLRGDCNDENQHEASAPDDLHCSPGNTTIDHEAYNNKNPACTADQSTPSVVGNALSIPLAAACPMPTNFDYNNLSLDDIPQPSNSVHESLQRPTVAKPLDELYCVPNDTPDNQANMELQPIHCSYNEKRSTQSKVPRHDSNMAIKTLGGHAGENHSKDDECNYVIPSSPKYTIAAGTTCTTGFHYYNKPFEDLLPSVEGECYDYEAQVFQPARTCSEQKDVVVHASSLPNLSSVKGMPTGTVQTACNGDSKQDKAYIVPALCSTKSHVDTCLIKRAISDVYCDRGSMVPKAICNDTLSKPSMVPNKMLFGSGQQSYQQQSKRQPKPRDYVYVASCRACFENAGTACIHCCGRKYGSQVKMKGTLDFGLGPWTIRTNGSAAKRPCGRPPPGTLFTVKCS